ncbi:HD domain-containing protein [Nanoarchaeota archaeon]
MDKEQIISKTAEYVKGYFKGESTGHDWWHTYRVWRTSQHIGQLEQKVDMFIVEMAALLHDVDDFKITGEHSDEKKNAMAWMTECSVDAEYQNSIVGIIQNMSYTDNIHGRKELSLEGQVVQDADRLDALGAIGIARCFAYGGKKGKPLHDPDTKPDEEMTSEKYISSVGTSVNHFYEKLLLLKELMNTDAGRKVAEGRHKFMEQYLEQFYKEWEGKD